jgi:hypothetical protein
VVIQEQKHLMALIADIQGTVVVALYVENPIENITVSTSRLNLLSSIELNTIKKLVTAKR